MNYLKLFVNASVLLVVISSLPGCSKNETVIPEKGVPFTDSLYSTTIVRITDKETDGYSGPGIQNEYARNDAYNYDDSRIMMRGNSGTWYVYDASNYQLLSDVSSVANQEPEPRWDAADPDIFYYVNQARLMSYDIGTGSSATIHDFSGDIANASYIRNRGEGDASLDSRHWCFMVEDSSWNLISVIVYDKQTDSIVGQKTSFSEGLDWVSMDMSGNHAIVGYESQTAEVFSLDLNASVVLPERANGHMDLALDAGGNDVMVYQNTATDWIAMADLATGTEIPLVQIPFDINTDIGLHFSGNCDATPGWVLVSTYGAKNPPAGEEHSWMDNLLFMVELKANPRVIKLAYTNCFTAQNADDVEKNYFAECFASINRAGTKVIFGSNWGDVSQAEYSDGYQLTMPSGWNQ
ncbi:MAG TPA: hypothetical protein VF399_05570 [bacterium]